MKKFIIIVVALVLAAGWVLWPSDPGPGGPHLRPLDEAADATPTLRPVAEGIDAPAPLDASARSVAPSAAVAAAGDGGTPTPELPWVVRGRVVFSDGASGPPPIVRVQLAAYDGYELAGEPFAAQEVESTADGALSWALGDPGRTVSIRVTLFDVPGYSARAEEHHLAVVGEGPVESIRVRVNPRDAWVEGFVRASEATAEPGAPIAGARVDYNEAHTTTDATGAYRMAVPSRGYGSLIATARGFQRGGETPGGLSAGATTRVDIALDPALGPEGTVFGYVRGVRGAVLAGARVRCGSAREDSVLTDATGYYELHDIRLHADAGIIVTATHDGFAAQEQDVRGPADGTPRAAGTQLDFALAPGSRVTGTVVDSSGAPVRGAEVWIGPHSGLVANRRARADDDGAFAFEHVTPGKTLLGVRKARQPGHVQDLTVPVDGAPLYLALTLERPVPLRGRVVDAAGAPIERAIVEARRGEYGRSIALTATTGADGAFVIDGVPVGALEVTAARRGLIRTSVTHHHDGRELALVVERAARIGGRVVDAATGRAIDRFLVRLAPPEDESLGPWFSGIDGSWLFGGKSFSAVDGTWSSDDKDPIRRGAWTYVEVEAAGYDVLRTGPLQVDGNGTFEEWVHALVRR